MYRFQIPSEIPVNLAENFSCFYLQNRPRLLPFRSLSTHQLLSYHLVRHHETWSVETVSLNDPILRIQTIVVLGSVQTTSVHWLSSILTLISRWLAMRKAPIPNSSSSFSYTNWSLWPFNSELMNIETHVRALWMGDQPTVGRLWCVLYKTKQVTTTLNILM
jgi:hypothetical protein